MTQNKPYAEGAASVALDDIVVSDVDTDPAQTITATLTLANTSAGVLTAGSGMGETYTAGTGVWTITGTIADVNTALAAVAFTPATNNDVDTTITTHIEDQNAAGPADGTITLDVTPANDPSTATNMTQNKPYAEGAASVALDDIVVSDVDTDPAQTITATLTLANTSAGVLTAGSGMGETYTAGTGVWTITGTIADVNTALAAVAFTPATNNDVDTTITTHIEDQDGAGPADGTITLDVTPANDPSTATNMTQNKPYAEGAASVALDDIVVSDVDTDPAQTITATLTLANTSAGVLTAASGMGETYTAGTGIWTITGTIADVNIALAAVAFTPATNNDVDTTITTHIEDQNAAGPADGTITLDVTPANDPSTATNLTQNKPYAEGAVSVALDDIVVSDIDTSQTITAQLTLNDTAAGSLTTGTFGATTSTYNGGTGVWEAIGTITDVNAALAAVAFTPNTNYDVDTTITTHIEDQDAAGPADGTITLDVTPANDAPTATNLIQNKPYAEGAASVALDDIVVSDVDTDPAQTITATLTLNNTSAGSLTAASGNGETYTAGTGVWTITASVAQVNAALAAVAFVPATNNDIDTTITTHIEDQNAAGPANGTITLDVTPAHDSSKDPVDDSGENENIPPDDPEEVIVEDSTEDILKEEQTTTANNNYTIPVKNKIVASSQRVIESTSLGGQLNSINITSYRFEQYTAKYTEMLTVSGFVENIIEEFADITENIYRTIEIIGNTADSMERNDNIITKTIVGGTLTLSAGVATWVLRGGSLIASALTTLPIWKGFDPLHVLPLTNKELRRKKKENRKIEKEEKKKNRHVADLFDEGDAEQGRSDGEEDRS